jgi:hypothetical protein
MGTTFAFLSKYQNSQFQYICIKRMLGFIRAKNKSSVSIRTFVSAIIFFCFLSSIAFIKKKPFEAACVVQIEIDSLHWSTCSDGEGI